MRILSLLFLTFFLGKSCGNFSQKDMETAVIIYEANTKGYYGKVIVKNHTVSVTRERGGELKTSKISDADWNYLVDEFRKVDLNTISNLKAPSEKRFYDGAAAANVTITFKGSTYVSSSFDHGNPPEEIKNLVNKIVSFINGN